MRSLSLSVLLASVVFAPGCSNNTPSTTPTPATVTALQIAGLNNLTTVGQTSQLTLSEVFSDGSSQVLATTLATWSSSDTTIATVSASGVVTAVAIGTATITATANGVSATTVITVAVQTGTPFDFLGGTWAGTWTDIRYGTSGPIQATFTVTGTTVTANGSIGLQVYGLGLGNEAATGTGTINLTTSTLTYTFSSPTVGTGSGTLSVGTGSGSGGVTGVLNLGPFIYSGTVTPTHITGVFQFTAPTGGNGVVNMFKQ
jgi:hypothetical protein